MARTAMGAKALQLFRGGLNALAVNPWVQNLGGECCDPAVAVAQDRLNPTVNPENANIHTRVFGNRDYWRFSDHDDSRRAAIVKHLNDQGVGAQLEVLIVPTFSSMIALHHVTLAEETGLAFTVKSRNGLALPAGGNLIQVSETDAAAGCGEVTRVQAAGAWTARGALGGASRVHTLGFHATPVAGFALEADVIILEVTALPVGGVKGFFDASVHVTYMAPGRSEASR